MSGGIPGGLANAERVYLSARILGQTRLCLLDSGSEVTLIPTSFSGQGAKSGRPMARRFQSRIGFLSTPMSMELEWRSAA